MLDQVGNLNAYPDDRNTFRGDAILAALSPRARPASQEEAAFRLRSTLASLAEDAASQGLDAAAGLLARLLVAVDNPSA